MMELWNEFDRLVVFDTETTGIEFGTDRIIEIGAAALENGEEQGGFNALIRLPAGQTLPHFITQLTGITDEQLRDEGVDDRTAAEGFCRLLDGAEQPLLVAYNAQFDLNFLYYLLRPLGLLSALQKSIRGSDPDAAVYYLGRLLVAGDLISPCRRLLCIAAEDIGLAYPQAITVTKSCVDAALQLGLPEARLPLAEAAVLLATAPKSNSAHNAIIAAMEDIQRGAVGDIPRHLKNVHADSAGADKAPAYKYPHNYPDHYVQQRYLPESLGDTHYYAYGENKTEQAARRYWDDIKRKNGNGPAVT